MSQASILIVDDDIALSRLAGLKLNGGRRYSTRAKRRSHGDIAAVRQIRPEMFLLDLDMLGDGDGELERELRGDPSLSRHSMVFFTSLPSEREVGCNGIPKNGRYYLARTTDLPIIERCIDRAITSLTL